MTTSPSVMMNTSSIQPNSNGGDNNSMVQVDEMDSHFGSKQTVHALSKGLPAVNYPSVISETEEEEEEDDEDEYEDEDEDDTDNDEDERGEGENVVVIVDAAPKDTRVYGSSVVPRRLSPLRGPTTKIEIHEPVEDSVDHSLFSPEISRHSFEVAHRRAKALELEVQELANAEAMDAASSMTPARAATEPLRVAQSMLVRSLGRIRRVLSGQHGQYDLLGGPTPASRDEDVFDTDGDGLQLSPDASASTRGASETLIKPVLKRISAYAHMEKDEEGGKSKSKRNIQWHRDVLAEDEEDGDFANGSEEAQTLMDAGSRHRMGDTMSRKRKKASKGGMRRLTPREKEALYQQRPDLMIIPNWAQKYREEMMEADSTRWSFWLLCIIGGLGVMLIVLVILILHEKASAGRPRLPNLR